MLCLWDLSEDILKLSQVQYRNKARIVDDGQPETAGDAGLVPVGVHSTNSSSSVASTDKPVPTSLSQKLATLNFGGSSKEQNNIKKLLSKEGISNFSGLRSWSRSRSRSRKEPHISCSRSQLRKIPRAGAAW